MCYVTALVGESRFIRRGEQGLNRRMAQLISGKRTIVGGDGFEWLVREFESVGAGALSKSLVFERPEVVHAEVDGGLRVELPADATLHPGREVGTRHGSLPVQRRKRRRVGVSSFQGGTAGNPGGVR